jgi:ELWxxDGT repeat protein
LVRQGSFVYFTASDGSGAELWRSDGTPAGTVLVKNISSKSGNPGPLELFVFQSRLYFSADDGEHGRELWQSDGTAEGTKQLVDFAAGLAGSRPDDFTIFGGKLFFTTTDATGNKMLWQTDGSAAGTLSVLDVGVAGQFTNANGSLYFSRNRGSAGFELWKSDGTAAGSELVKALPFGPNGTDPNHLQEANGLLFFQTKIPGKAVLWVSDGTADGTTPINTTGSALLNRQLLTNVSGKLLFAGTDAVHGQELWKLTTANPQVQFSGTLNFTENDPLKLIAPAGSITDADNTDFSAGRLSVVVQQAGPGDRLQIRNQGSGIGQVGVSGREVRFGGVLIGLLREGLPASQTIVDLNADASVAATQALLRNVGFRALGDNPLAGQRLVAVRLTDGSGGISRTVTKSISVQAVNDPPRLVLSGQVAYQNNSAGVLLAPSATVTDADSANFAGALLTIEITTARGPSNRLQLGGGYSIDSDRLLRNGVVVGTVLENGFGWNDLRLRFNSQMTAARVQELVRSLRFRTVDNTNLDPRTFSFSLTDGDGGKSATQTKTVNLTA